MVEFRKGEPAGGQRIVNRRQFDRLVGYLALTHGKVVLGGASDPERLTIEPTIILEPGSDEPAMTEEIFGPILPVVSVGSVDEAIRFVNARPHPLAAYVFTRSGTTRRRFTDEVRSGMTVVNDAGWQAFVPHLPFGGVGPSGMGVYHGRWGFETFSHRQAVLAKTFRPEIRIVYPPYTERAFKLLRKVF
jgi:aldehyde dehydrogenase (NAD+)